MIADERWLELLRTDRRLADDVWDGTCPAIGDRPLFVEGVTELITSARSAATADEHAAEARVVARMQQAVSGVAQLEQPRHRRQRALHRIAAAKAAAVVAVLALGAATATGATSEVISLVWGWVDDFVPGTNTDRPDGGTPASTPGTGSGMHARDNMPFGQLGQAGPPTTASSGALSGADGSSLDQADELSGEHAGDQDGATSIGSENSSSHDRTEPAQNGRPENSGASRPLGDLPTDQRGPPGPSGPLVDGGGVGPAGDGGMPPGLQMSPWGGANPALSDDAAAES